MKQVGWKTHGYLIVAAAIELVFVGNDTAAGNLAAAAELPPQGTVYERGHNRHPDTWAGQMDEKPQVSS